MQRCLEIRKTGIGQDGRIVLFNRPTAIKPDRKRPAVQPAAADHPELVESLRSLGLAATGEAVGAAVEVVFPGGVEGVDQGEVVRKVFLHLQGRRS